MQKEVLVKSSLKHKFKRLKKRLISRLSRENHPLFTGYYRYLYRPRPQSLAAFLDRYSRATPTFFVIQVGANDGITHDPIHKFIKRDGWAGILLEPQQAVWEQELSRLYENQPGIVTLHAAMGPADGQLPMYKIGFSDARWATGLSSFRKEVVENAFRTGHVQRQATKQGIAVPSDEDTWIIQEQVPVISWSTLVERHQISRIDLLQIDTEGYELEIIKMIDFEACRPQAIVFENMHLSPDDQAHGHSLLRTQGYDLYDYDENTLALTEQLSHLVQSG